MVEGEAKVDKGGGPKTRMTSEGATRTRISRREQVRSKSQWSQHLTTTHNSPESPRRRSLARGRRSVVRRRSEPRLASPSIDSFWALTLDTSGRNKRLGSALMPRGLRAAVTLRPGTTFIRHSTSRRKPIAPAQLHRGADCDRGRSE